MVIDRRRGRILREQEIGTLLVSDIEYPAGSYLERHNHARPYISILIDGSYTELCDGLPRVCAPGTVIVHPPREEHSDYFLSSGRCINVDIPSAWLEVDGASAARRSSRVRLREDDRIMILNAFSEARQALRRAALERAILDLAGSTRLEEHSVEDSVPSWLRALLRSFPWIAPVPLAQAALRAGVHQTHFARAFRKYVGVTAGEYRKRARLRHASRLLLESSAALTDIAHSAGFSDQSHFANAFRSVTGMAPGAYRVIFSA